MKRLFFCLVIVLMVYACKEVYESPVVSPPTGYLVVEGAVNSGAGSTTIKLSRTTGLDNREIKFEDNAAVSIEGEDNSSRGLNFESQGQYTGEDLQLNNAIKYRLRVNTSNGQEFLSDYTVVKNNPPIDSVSWKRESSGANDNGVQIYINTHDPADTTRYYQWEFAETWEYNSRWVSNVKYQIGNLPNGDKIYKAIFRYPDQPQKYDSSLFFCWRYSNSSNIYIGSSAKLSKDVINLPLYYIPSADEKISVLYSVNVRQFSLTKQAYEFLERMRKNTEQTGSIFDAQPSSLFGNIHNTADANEPVIGFFSICPIQEKRLFIKRSQVQGWNYQFIYCPEDTILNNSDTIKVQGLGRIPTSEVLCMNCPPDVIVSFYASTPECVDCKTRGGTNIKPPFWPW